MFNGLLQTPVPIAGMQFYGTAGGGVYRETLDEDLGDERGDQRRRRREGEPRGPAAAALRLPDLHAAGRPRHSKPQRFYAGLNLKF